MPRPRGCEGARLGSTEQKWADPGLCGTLAWGWRRWTLPQGERPLPRMVTRLIVKDSGRNGPHARGGETRSRARRKDRGNRGEAGGPRGASGLMLFSPHSWW